VTNRDFTLTARDISFVCEDLSRPECVLAQDDGVLWISDNRGGVTRRDPDGRQTVLGSIPGSPNGLAIDRRGDLYVANMATCALDRLGRDGRHETVLDLSPSAVNFVYADPTADRLWVTTSTTVRPPGEAAKRPTPDGAIVLVENGAARTVADGICFTNEVRLSPEGDALYVAETAHGRILRFPVAADGSLGPRSVYGPATIFPGALIDGIAFDAEGNLWITELSRHSLHMITPEGEARCVFEDPDAEIWRAPTSIAFGGPDLRTAYVGSLVMSRLATFRTPAPGRAMAHWRAQTRI
jgi:gluconolactonase